MKYSFLIFVCLVLLASCSPSKRLARLVKNNPDLVSSDTIYRIDTTVVQGLTDTADFVFGHSDTLYFENARMALKMAISYDTINTIKGPIKIPSGLKLIATDKPDTIINKTATVINSVNPVKVEKSGLMRSLRNVALLIGFMGLLYLIFLFVKSSLNGKANS